MGDDVVADLTARDIVLVYNKMADNGISKITRAPVNVKLRQLLQQAMMDGYIRESPIDKMPAYAIPTDPPPDSIRHEERKIALDEANALMSQIRKEPRGGLWAAVWLSYMLGLRRGECMELTWSDFDESKMAVHIQKQMSQQDETPPKTAKADRVFPVTWPV